MLLGIGEAPVGVAVIIVLVILVAMLLALCKHPVWETRGWVEEREARRTSIRILTLFMVTDLEVKESRPIISFLSIILVSESSQCSSDPAALRLRCRRSGEESILPTVMNTYTCFYFVRVVTWVRGIICLALGSVCTYRHGQPHASELLRGVVPNTRRMSQSALLSRQSPVSCISAYYSTVIATGKADGDVVVAVCRDVTKPESVR